MRLRKIGCVILAAALILPLSAPTNSCAAGRFTDTSGHWAERYINTAVDQKIITGYPDGRFLPDKAVTRAEFATMVNKALGINSLETLTFSDVYYGEWYYNDVAKALAATYTAGYDDNTFRPDNPITRQEAAVMISRIVPTYGQGGNLRSYPDYRSIADWAYASVEKANGRGYIGAYNDGKIHPTDKLTRAQTAKIICEILDHETISAGTPVIDDDGTKLSGRIYSNGVTIDDDLGENNAAIDNCVVLGNLSIKGGGPNSITINNSRVSRVTVDKGSSPVRVIAKGETAVVRLSASQTSILQTSGLSGGLFGPGFSNVTVNGSADVTLQGSFPKVEISGSSAKAVLDSGAIETLTVNGRYSNITADSGASIKTANVNTESYFHGSGTIYQMNVSANGVTYETKPRNWTIASSYDTPRQSDEINNIAYSPKNGATNVALDAKITITFDTAIEMYDGDSISNSDIDDFVELRKDSSSGSYVPYTATISSSEKVITITPDSSLSRDTKYYVVIDKNSVRDDSHNGNTAQSVYFYTGNDYDHISTTFSPGNGASTVPVNTGITISFSEEVVRYSNGATISSNDSYLKDCIVFKKTSSSGDSVSYSASINSSKKTITITPNSTLSLNQKYYVAVLDNRLKAYSDGETVHAASVTWTTGVTAPVLSSFSVSPGDTAITAAMTPNVAGRAYVVVLPSGAAAPSAAQIAAGQNSSGAPAMAYSKNENVAAQTPVTLPTMTGFGSGVAYDVWATLYSPASGTYSAPVKQTVTTTTPKIFLDSLTVKPIVNGAVRDDNQISFQQSSSNYTIKVNDSIASVELRASGDSSAAISVTGAQLGTVTGVGAVKITVDIISNPTLTVTVSAAGKATATYTVSLGHANDASLKLLKIGGSAQTLGGNSFTYAISTSAAAVVTLEAASNDKYAAVIAPTGADVKVTALVSGLGYGFYNLELPEGSFPVAIVFGISSGSSSSPYTVTFTRP